MWLWGRHIGGRARRDCGGLQAVCVNPAVGTAAGLCHNPNPFVGISLVTSKFVLWDKYLENLNSVSQIPSSVCSSRAAPRRSVFLEHSGLVCEPFRLLPFAAARLTFLFSQLLPRFHPPHVPFYYLTVAIGSNLSTKPPLSQRK